MADSKIDPELPSYEDATQYPSHPFHMNKWCKRATLTKTKGVQQPDPAVVQNYAAAGGQQPTLLAAQQQQPYATAPPMQANAYGSMGTTAPDIFVQPSATRLPSVVTWIGDCPVCRMGVLEDSYSCLGLLCAIVFFPIGILCCLTMRNKRCNICGAEL